MSPNSLAFSKNGEYLAVCTPDGSLKIWESSSGQLIQEYIPSSHLVVSAVCLCWNPGRPMGSAKKKKKKRDSGAITEEAIALGTASGEVLLYSVAKCDLVSQLSGSHTDRVNGVSWGAKLYSCSNDHHIVEWGLEKGRELRRWKADKGGVTAIQVLPDDSSLLSASRKIKWWNLSDLSVIRTFRGHAAEVTSLVHVPMMDATSAGSYFVSAAHSDRILNAWHLSTEEKSKDAAATFSMQESPLELDVLPPSEDDEAAVLAALTTAGQLHLFSHVLNGRTARPVSPKRSLRLYSDETEEQDVPVLSIRMCANDRENVLIAHGSFIRPTFERIALTSLNKSTRLKRETMSRSKVQLETGIQKIKAPEVSDKFQHLAPGYAATTKDTRPMKRKEKGSRELSMEERLMNTLTVQSKQDKGPKDAYKASSLVHLLQQGLQSEDSKILQNIIRVGEEDVVRNTVKRLPVQAVLPFMKYLHNVVAVRSDKNTHVVKWMKMVLQFHSSYLRACPDVDLLLGPVWQLIKTRSDMLPGLCALRGRLDLIQDQTELSNEPSSQHTQALLNFNDVSSDEEMDAAVLPHSESEDPWDEISNAMESEDEEMSESGSDDELSHNGLDRTKRRKGKSSSESN